MTYQHAYVHPGPQDCRDYAQCHARAYGYEQTGDDDRRRDFLAGRISSYESRRLDDDEKRPSWITTDQQARLYEAVKEKARFLGFTGMAAGWKYKPQRVGEMVVIRKDPVGSERVELRVEAATPMAAIELMNVYLGRLDRAV